ncbi:MAG TPA: hypothetical protein PLY52_04390 [Methanothrix sp.]|jgi:hypothetical protein|uniref:hypothetical protein n=1 Tax=Methanothrix sp. TaxID=90426 RepID=UPI002C69012F|nr:hypothetical protein [Methanothrix sp.]MDI9416745.1 hypothetical protein [Euryarchaeota archaeon]HON35535.1 hypothetical protein [Methanothrix sp.]HRU74594.1 hypothetical protein [Methanothrix sp.]
MSQIFRISRPFILMAALITLAGLFMESCSCQEDFYFTNAEDDDGFYFETMMPIDEPADALTISSKDIHSVSSFSNSPMGLWSMMNTAILTEDGTIKKSRNYGLISYGSELMQIFDYSWLTIEDGLGGERYNDGYVIDTTLHKAVLPFAVLREDSLTLTDLVNVNNETMSSISVTKLLLYEDFYKSYDISALNEAFGNSSTVEEVLFRYDPELGELNPLSASSLDLSIFEDFWAGFGSIFNNQDIMKMFNDYAKEQLEREKQEQNNKDQFERIENMFNKCDGGVCCKWGTSR